MYDKFGEFDSAEELNQAAEGLFNEGDIENIYVLASENGIDVELVTMYIEGEIPFLADAAGAAIGKIEAELKEAEKTYGMTAVCIAEYVKSLCDREVFAVAVRRKGKSLQTCIQNMQHAAEKQVKKRSGTQCVCIPPSAGYQMIRDYYMGGEK